MRDYRPPVKLNSLLRGTFSTQPQRSVNLGLALLGTDFAFLSTVVV